MKSVALDSADSKRYDSDSLPVGGEFKVDSNVSRSPYESYASPALAARSHAFSSSRPPDATSLAAPVPPPAATMTMDQQQKQQRENQINKDAQEGEREVAGKI